MIYCSSCGEKLEDKANFCWKCGSKVVTKTTSTKTTAKTTSTKTTSKTTTTKTTATKSTTKTDDGYSIVLLSEGTLTVQQTAAVLVKLLGYSELQAYTLLTLLPAECVKGLTKTQARYVAQTLSELGMKVAVYYGKKPVDVSAEATSSVFDEDGGIIATASKILSSLSPVNLLANFAKMVTPEKKEEEPITFKPAFEPRAPKPQVKPVVQTIPKPEPKPAPQPMPTPQPKPVSGHPGPKPVIDAYGNIVVPGAGPDNYGMGGHGSMGQKTSGRRF